MNRKERRAQAARERKLPGYYDAVLRQLVEIEPGKLTHVFVQHDEWCALLKGRGDCNCNPDVSSRSDRVS
jgi:hypothetical protein